MSFAKLHVRKIFELYIPVSGFAQIGVALSTTPSFGVTITQPNIPNFNYHYQIQLYNRENEDEDFVVSASDHEVFAWGKRNPYTIKRNPINNELEGIILKMKINHGVFKFQKIKKHPVRFQVNCFNAAQFIQRGLSQICELNPKKRGADDGDGEDDARISETDICYLGVTIPVMWLSNDNIQSSPSIYDSPSYHSSDQNYQSGSPDQLDSPYEAKFDIHANINVMDSSDMDTSADDSSLVNSQHIVPIQQEASSYDQQIASPQEEQYMVLYNGNAEVVGNFRALNFYKASDINLKEDIRLLQEDYDCRESLLKIDGVEYKFKDHVNHATNKRFVGYIAQQIGSVIPNAVQLIDGILHVDYESLIPYLSEAMKQNFQDIKNVKSETERITKIMDLMYAEFTQKEQRRKEKQKKRDTASEAPSTREEFDVEPGYMKNNKFPTGSGTSTWKKCLISITIAVAVIISVGITVAIFRFSRQKNNQDGNADIVPLGDDALVREALREFYRTTKGGTWKFSQGWMQSNLTYCKWRAITCNDQSEIIGIYLAGNNLQGVIPQSIQSIKTLQALTLSDNSLSGKVPSSISALQNLTELDLSRNYFDPWNIPEEFVQLTKLKKLFLDNTRLVGTVPAWLNTLKELKILQMSENALHGTLPKLSNTLREVDLTSNQLSGSVPRFFGNTTQLNVLKLGSNRLTGQLTNLQSVAWVDLIDLSNNQLEGDIAAAGNGILDSVSALNMENNLFEALTYDAGNVPRKLAFCKCGGNRFKCPIAYWLKNGCSASCK